MVCKISSYILNITCMTIGTLCMFVCADGFSWKFLGTLLSIRLLPDAGC